MDGQDSDFLKQLFGNAQEIPEGLSHHIATASGGVGDDTDRNETAFGSVPNPQIAQQLEQGAPGNPIHTGGMHGHAGVASSHHHFNPIDYHQSSPGWTSSSQSPHFSGTDLSAALGQHAFDPYAFMPYADGHTDPSAMGQMLLYGTNYAAPPPPDAHPHPSFSYDWNTIDPSDLGADPPAIAIDAAATHAATAAPNAAAIATATTGLTPPWGLGMAGPSASTSLGTATPASFTSGSSSGTVAGFQSATSSEFSEGRPSRRSSGGGSARKGREGGRRRAKKPKPMPLPLQMPTSMAMPPPALGSPSAHRRSLGPDSLAPLSPLAMAIDSAGGSGSGSGSLPTVASSSSSRTQPTLRSPKIAAPRPSEAREEKKTRSSHNLVEKQYRNRLNSQFEGLMNALPEKLRSESSGGSEYGEVTAALESADKRLSKAEVLELARRHIQSLEQERDMLERERDGLKGSVTRLKKELEEAAEGGASVEDLMSIEEAIEEVILKASGDDDGNSVDEAGSLKMEDDDTRS